MYGKTYENPLIVDLKPIDIINVFPVVTTIICF